MAAAERTRASDDAIPAVVARPQPRGARPRAPPGKPRSAPPVCAMGAGPRTRFTSAVHLVTASWYERQIKLANFKVGAHVLARAGINFSLAGEHRKVRPPAPPAPLAGPAPT